MKAKVETGTDHRAAEGEPTNRKKQSGDSSKDSRGPTRCNCGADRTGPSAEAHLADCPEANPSPEEAQ